MSHSGNSKQEIPWKQLLEPLKVGESVWASKRGDNATYHWGLKLGRKFSTTKIDKNAYEITRVECEPKTPI